ncbi:hypothetical protein HED60_07550 [Planctomycetales bacterium ZRK34]|nr:hypothetical protein HED60_07550 [Planctomycetales bacterium ZRK34]
MLLCFATGAAEVFAADPVIPEGVNKEDLSPEQLRELRIRKAQRLLEQMNKNKNKPTPESAPEQPAPGQDQPAEAPPGVKVVQLDLQTLLSEGGGGRGRTSGVEDPIWEFELPPGQKLMLVPLNPLPVDQPVDLDMFKTMRLVGARQLAWYLPDDQDARGGRRGGGRRGGHGELQIDPPLLAINVTLRRGNVVHYTLARRINYAKLSERGNQAYAVLLDRNQLKRPELPTRTNNADSRQRLEAMVEYRQAMDNYNRQIAFVQQLPIEFTKPTPSVIYGVFAVPVLARDIEFSGLEGDSWKVPLDLLQRLQEYAGGRSNHFEIDQALAELLKIDHVYSQRTAAIVIADSGVMSKLPADSPLIGKIQTLLQSNDRATRMRLVSALASSKSSVPIVGELLAKAVSDPDPEVGLIAMQAQAGEVSGKGQMSPAQVDALADGAQRLLVKAEDQPVAEVLAVPLEAAGKRQELVKPFAEKIDLTQAPASRRAAMVDLVVEGAAAGELLPMRWLSDQLLGGGDADLQQRTLSKILAMAEPAPEAGKNQRRRSGQNRFDLYSANHGLMDCLASPSASVRAMAWKALEQFEVTRNTRGRGGRDGENPLDRSEPSAIYDALVTASLAVKPTPTQIVRVLEPEVREPEVAAALQRVMLEGHGPTRLAAMRLILPTSGKAAGDWLVGMTADQRLITARVWYERYPMPEGDVATTVDPAAAAKATSKPTAGGFFGMLKAAIGAGGNQPANAPADQDANAPAENGAETPAAPTQAAEMTPDMQAPLSVGLLRITVIEGQTRPPIFDWFGEQMAEDLRPRPRQWAQAFANPDALLIGMASPDEPYALACCEAMISTVVAPTPGTAEQLRAAAVQHAGSIQDPVQQAEQLATIWQTVKQQLAEQLTEQVPGKYKMTLKIYERGKQPAAAGAKFTPYDLGEVLINLNGGSVALGPEPLDAELVATPFAISLVNPQQLVDIAAKKGSELDLALTPEQPVNLEPAGAGNYSGKVNARGQVIGVELIRQP